MQDSGETLSSATRQALDRVWSLQIREGKAQGAWPFFELDLDPWETNGESPFFGASMATLAVGTTPAGYRKQPEIRQRIGDLTAYLLREQEAQPLHNRLMALWASTKLADVLTEPARQSILGEVWRKQQADGGWTSESLGPWKKREAARLYRKQWLRHGGDCLRTGKDGRLRVRSPAPPLARLVAHPSGPRIRIVAGRLAEQTISARFDADPLHARCGDGIRRPGIARIGR
jgi:hypothetical protein